MTLIEQTISVDHLNVNFWEDGQGNARTLLLIHGGVGDAQLHWAPAMPTLAETFHVLAPDLPGFGKSDLLPQMKIVALMDWLQAFIQSQNLEQAVIIGNASGGLIARLFAASHPAIAPAVILVNGGGVPDIPAALRLIEKIPGLSTIFFSIFGSMGTNDNMLNRMVHVKSLLTDEFRANARRARKGFAKMMRMLVSSPKPAEQTPLVPTLILWGADDGFTPLSEGKAISNSIPGSTLIEITDCGNMPQLETPDVFLWQIDSFLNKLSRPPKSSSPGAKILSNPSG
jgi:pimeloyl-ACP methyl ester carboxylesterase